MLKEYLSVIANAIRSKLGINTKINAQSFPEKINDVYAKGKKDEWSDFWDSIQMTNGSFRTGYDYFFYGGAWNDSNFRPKYDIRPTSGGGVSVFSRCGVKDLENCLSRGGVDGKGVRLDLTKCTNIGEIFARSKIEIIPELAFSTSTTSAWGMFTNCNRLHTVRKFAVNPKVQIGTNFSGCTALKNIVIEGEVIDNANFQWCKELSRESIASIVEALSVNVSGKTLTLSADAVNNMIFPFASSQSGITYNSWEELKNTKITNWTFSLL